MKKYTDYWLKRARNKLKLKQKEVAGDKFTRSFISMVETGEVGLSYEAREYILKRLKLPKSYFDTGLFRQEKKKLDKLIEGIEILIDSYNFDKAHDKALGGLSISEEAKNDNYTNSFLLKLAIINIKKKNLKKAEDILKKTNKYFEEEKDFYNLAHSYYWTAVLNMKKQKDTDAVFMFNSAISENSKLKGKRDSSIEARALVKIAQIYRWIENYKGAKINCQKAIKIAEESKDDYILAMAYWEYAMLLHRINEYNETIKYYSLAAPIYKALGYEKLTLQINNNLASLYHYIGDYDKAIKLTEKTIKISKDKNYINELAYAYLKGAKAKRDKELLNEAENDLNKSIVLLKELKDNRMLGEAYMALGLLHEKKKENNKAILSFNKAIDIFKDLDQPSYILSAYVEIMSFYKDIGSLDKEREYIEKLKDKIKRIIF